MRADDTIVVIGYPPDDEALRDYVAEVGRATAEDQYGRWYDELCPTVVGLRAEIGNYVLETIRSVAELADAPLANGASCRANLVVLFTVEPDNAIVQLQNTRPDLFGAIPPATIASIVGRDETISVVSRLRTRGSAGQYGTTVVSAGYRGRGGRAGDRKPSMTRNPLTRVANNLPGEAAMGGNVHNQAEGSRVVMATRPEFDFRLMVVDLNDLEGQTIRQLSAYTAMIALGDFNLEQPIESQQSILNALHEPDTAPADITDWDLAYLRGLYQARPARNAASQRRAIVSVSRRALRSGRFEER